MLDLNEFRDHFYYDGGFFYVKKPLSKKHKFGARAGTVAADHHRLTFKGKAYRLSKLVWFYHYGVFPDRVTHVNGDHYDCRLENLRAIKSE